MENCRIVWKNSRTQTTGRTGLIADKATAERWLLELEAESNKDLIYEIEGGEVSILIEEELRSADFAHYFSSQER